MYRVAGVGQVSAPITAAPRLVVVGPRRVWTRGPGGRWRSVSKARLKAAGVGCACGCGDQCGGGGMGQAASLSQIGTDAGSLISDVFQNSDGSVNWTVVAFAGAAAALVFVNWGHTTRRGKR